MSLFRLSPTNPRLLRPAQGRCAACGKHVSAKDVAVRIYGDLLHQSCAYYRPRLGRSDHAA